MTARPDLAGLTLEEIEALCAEATPGPWEISQRGSVVGPQAIPHDNPTMNRMLVCDEVSAEDAAFITAARTLVPALRDRVRELEAALQEWRECALYDATMEGPVFKGWNRSALDRCRLKNATLPAPPAKEKGETDG